MLKFSVMNIVMIVIIVGVVEWGVEGWMCREGWCRTNKLQHFDTTSNNIFNVIQYGAQGDGISDDTMPFQEAWRDACQVQGSTILVPSNFVFLVKPTIFLGYNCSSNIKFQLNGNLVAPENGKAWASRPQAWLQFEKVKGIRFEGKGILDGKGSIWWNHSSPNLPVHGSSNKINSDDEDGGLLYGQPKGKLSSAKPVALMFSGCLKVVVTGITILNSPQKHLKISMCVDVKIFRINISSPDDSPNTDGINISRSQHVVIHNVNISCGDDCISILGGCSKMEIYGVICGPGHGISIGSLGRDHTKDIVSNISVRDSIIKNALTGVRIKTWQGGSGMVKHINFSNIQVHQVKTPIEIDQYYCDNKAKCKNQTSSAVSISGITYDYITGTYTKLPLYLACSESSPCRGITMAGIELNADKGSPTTKPFCWFAFGQVLSKTIPPITCLRTEIAHHNDQLYFSFI